MLGSNLRTYKAHRGYRRSPTESQVGATNGASLAAEAARTAAVETHLPLLKYHANQVRRRNQSHIDFEDLLSAGLEGFALALRLYDPGRGASLWSYAYNSWVRNLMRDEVRQFRWPMPISERDYKAVVDMQRAYNSLSSRLGRMPRKEELARFLHWRPKRFGRVYRLWAGPSTLSLDQVRGPDGNSTLADLISDHTGILIGGAQDGVPSVEDEALLEAHESERQRAVREALGALATRERLVLTLRFGLEDWGNLGLEDKATLTKLRAENIVRIEGKIDELQQRHRNKPRDIERGLTGSERRVWALSWGDKRVRRGDECSLEEVGQLLKLSGERVRQIQAKALRAMRHPSRSKKLKPFLE